MRRPAVWLLSVATAALLINSGDAFGSRSFWFEGLPDPPAARSAGTPSIAWIEQPVDHFNPRDNRTWSMRYYENDQFLSESNAPILIMIGGEWEITPGWLRSGQMYNLASTYGAMMYYTEHRYYGESYPTNNTSSENLQYLNVDQALADLAYFIEIVKKQRNLENSTVVLFGGSYAGNMAAWARIKYPHLIKGALASSAPILAKADFYEYYEVVTVALSRYSSQCSVDVNDAFLAVEELLQTSTGPETLKRFFNLCNDIDTSSWQDVASLLNTLAGVFAGVVQYDAVDSTGQSSVGRMCDVMTATYLGSPLQRLAYLTSWSTCVDTSYASLVEAYINEDWNSYAATSAMRPWYYQTCTEYGYYQTANSDKSVFGTLFQIEFFTELCKDLYGDYYNEYLLDSAVTRTNIVYGGLKPEVTNVIFTNGDLDPWHALSVLEDLNESSPAILVMGTSHCQDLYSDLSTDSAEMTAAKARVRELVGQWLS
ncbi:thymus-specific serine protease-like [Neodiprion virginianus]|uniref:thymus-specific serine protease-like n=1 Tax=Neodiprion virginianus TaxID=2961670 RepID=UPI001EE6D1A0|nr:thymus-specific serine protease-like [Neodiprion virginianus]XP_046606657.1 thymus-specific serine protease-like [Neodiprion virginianus]